MFGLMRSFAPFCALVRFFAKHPKAFRMTIGRLGISEKQKTPIVFIFFKFWREIWFSQPNSSCFTRFFPQEKKQAF